MNQFTIKQEDLDALFKDVKMEILNDCNGAHEVVVQYSNHVAEAYPNDHKNVVLMGIAYGGEVEAIAKWYKKKGIDGTVYGYDTFEDLHPKHLAEDKNSFEATCMDSWYGQFGVEKISHEYQTKVLSDQGLDNAKLIKGEVNKDSCKGIDKIHMVFLDMDMVESMRSGFEAVAEKVVSGGYIILHDAIPKGHIPKVHEWVFNELLADGTNWVLDFVKRNSFIVIIKKK